MEAVTLAGLVGLGYLVARTAGPSTNTKAVPATTTAKAGANYPNAPGAPRRAYENFENPRDLPPGSVLMNTPKGASATGAPAELDLMFQTPNGRTYPSEPYPGPYGMPIGYASQKPPIAARAPPNASPAPQPIEAVAPSIAMNPAGVEQNPNYANTMGGPQGEYVVSQLSGERMPSKDFKHSNMVPFFGGRIKQNVAVDTNISILDSYTGAGSTDIRKKEVETMFNTSQTPFGNPFGMEDNTDFFQSRMDDPALRRRDGERPFEPERIGPAVKEKFGMTGKGGFQQLEVNEIMMRAMPTSDKLRVADNPKMTYKTPVVPGQRFSLRVRITQVRFVSTSLMPSILMRLVSVTLVLSPRRRSVRRLVQSRSTSSWRALRRPLSSLVLLPARSLVSPTPAVNIAHPWHSSLAVLVSVTLTCKLITRMMLTSQRLTMVVHPLRFARTSVWRRRTV